MLKSKVSRRQALAAGGGLALTAYTPRALALPNATSGGFSPSRLAEITKSLRDYIDKGALPGVVSLIYRRGELVQENILGLQNRETPKGMARDSIFRLASMSKPITAVAALTLVEQGKIALKDPIDRWLPELANRVVLNDPSGSLTATHPATQPITVADLMTHRSGIGYYFTTQGPLSEAYKDAFPPTEVMYHPAALTVDEWLRRLSGIPLAYDPGSRWLYGQSTDVLGALIARASGMSFSDYLKEAVFDPLELWDTGLWMPKAKQARIATVYMINETGPGTPLDLPVSEIPLKFGSGAGGLLSTAGDYLKFARMLLGGGSINGVRVLSHRLTTLMTTNWLTPAQRRMPTTFGADFFAQTGFGLNLEIVEERGPSGAIPYASQGSYNWPGVYGTTWEVDPHGDMAYVFMSATFANAPAGNSRRGRASIDFAKLTYEAITS
jgi:CubicO group peptidase (beta-lactamase class C family)